MNDSWYSRDCIDVLAIDIHSYRTGDIGEHSNFYTHT